MERYKDVINDYINFVIYICCKKKILKLYISFFFDIE